MLKEYLKEYDAIIDELSLAYDVACNKRYRDKATYSDTYCLLNSQTKTILCFDVPKHITNSNPVTMGVGKFAGNISSGKVTVTLQGGKTFSIDINQPANEKKRLENLYSVCDELILREYPIIHGKYISVRNYLLENDYSQYDLIWNK